MYLIISIIAILISGSQQSLNSTFINLKQILNGNIYQLASQQINTKQIQSAQIYSSQLNEQIVNQFFKLENKTHLVSLKTLNRLDLCSNMKYCDKLTNSSDQLCLLNLNFIFYLKPIFKQSHVNQIKSSKLYLIVSDFNSTYLKFDQLNYEFNLSNETEVGSIQASIDNDSDLNGLIKYFLEFEDQDRADYNNLFQIDTNNGSVTLNRQYLINFNNKKTFEFHVNAVIQCSLAQKALRNRTLVRVHIDNENRKQFRIKNLIETKILVNSIECIRLREKDLINESNQSIALAQIIVENSFGTNIDLETDLKLFGFQPNNTNYNQLTRDNLAIQHLIDNIFVVYLVKTNFEQIFLNDIYKIQLQVNKSILDIYLCIDTLDMSNLFTDSFSLVQFVNNIHHLNPPVHINSNEISSKIFDSSSVVLEAYQLSTTNSNIQFYLDDNLSSNLFNLTLSRVDSTKTKLIFANSLVSQDSVIEKLQYELIGIAFDSNSNSLFNESAANSHDYKSQITQLKRVVYNDLTRQALNNKKFLRFTSKIFINTKKEIYINDSTAIYHNESNIYKFYVNSNKLIKNSIVGYLPNIYDLNTKYSLSFNTKQIEYLYYSLSAVNLSSDCFKLNKFDGVLTFTAETPTDCFNNITEMPLKLKVSLSSVLDNSINDDFSQIWIYSQKSEKNESSVNIIYDANDSIIPTETSKVIKRAGVNSFSLSYLFNIDKNFNHNYEKQLPSFLKLVDLVSNFKANLSENQFDSKTTFEFIQLEKSLNDLFVFDTKKNSIYLNVTKSIGDKFIQFKCYQLEVVAKNYIYLNAVKRKLISFDSFQLNLCFFNNETISYKDFIANNFSFGSLIVPFQNENSLVGFQQFLMKNYSESSNIILVFFILTIIGMIIASLILVATYLKRSKNIQETPSKQTVYTGSQYPSMNKYYSSSIDTTTTDSTNISPTVLLKIRNDLSFENNRGNIILQDKNGQIFAIESSVFNKLTKTNSNSSSSSNDLNAYGAPSKRVPISPTIPESYASFDRHDSRDKESSEDQGVGSTSFSMSSNISSVTNSQYVDSDFSNSSSNEEEVTNNNNIPISPIDITRLSLFDMTPTRSKQNKLTGRNIYTESGYTFVNELNTNVKYSDEMRNWIIGNYQQNCAKTPNHKINKQNVECII